MNLIIVYKILIVGILGLFTFLGSYANTPDTKINHEYSQYKSTINIGKFGDNKQDSIEDIYLSFIKSSYSEYEIKKSEKLKNVPRETIRKTKLISGISSTSSQFKRGLDLMYCELDEEMHMPITGYWSEDSSIVLTGQIRENLNGHKSKASLDIIMYLSPKGDNLVGT